MVFPHLVRHEGTVNLQPIFLNFVCQAISYKVQESFETNNPRAAKYLKKPKDD